MTYALNLMVFTVHWFLEMSRSMLVKSDKGYLLITDMKIKCKKVTFDIMNLSIGMVRPTCVSLAKILFL